MTILSDPTIQETIKRTTKTIREADSQEAAETMMELIVLLAYQRGQYDYTKLFQTVAEDTAGLSLRSLDDG